jgi:hypothetical protein
VFYLGDPIDRIVSASPAPQKFRHRAVVVGAED